MHKKSFTFGLGVGILAMCAVFYLLYGFQKTRIADNAVDNYVKAHPTAAAEIITPTAPPTNPPTAPPTETPTNPPTEPPTAPPTETPTNPPTEPPTEPQTEPPTETEPPIIEEPTAEPAGEPTAEPASEPTEEPVIDERPAAINPGPEGFVAIYIPKGYNATQIAALMAEAGIVDDSAAFRDYIVAAAYTLRLSSGDFLVPLDLTYEDALNIIKLEKPAQ